MIPWESINPKLSKAEKERLWLLVPLDDVRALEKDLGRPMPADWVEMVTTRGLPPVEPRWMTPAEIRQALDYQRSFSKVAKGDPRVLEREQQVRDQMIPFAFMRGGRVLDVFAFYPPISRDGKPMTVDLVHDDLDYASWLLAESPNLDRAVFGAVDFLLESLKR